MFVSLKKTFSINLLMRLVLIDLLSPKYRTFGFPFKHGYIQILNYAFSKDIIK